ncbi:DUF7059 domain-containing protein [Ornithinimicrobium pratense]|uniref:Methyltransferase n=1 Tax=Ornithinimicrobium pratense TaxID=2593973 RepID=A0A5J6V354_9MICO|nr:methyltransferase [Ornithinimicrobium pratense]QFG67602.1 methyltransferase [Ornithinimicrobium pratense]
MSSRPSESQPPPSVASPRLLAGLREDLREAAYTVDGLDHLLGPVASGALYREQPLPATRATAAVGGQPAACLLRCFVLGLPVDAPDLAAALPRTGTGGLLELGLVRRAENGALRATCDLRPYGTEEEAWWVASDLSELAIGGPLSTDHVLGIGGASTTLASWAPRPRVRRALDLGTGCGVQALHLAGHATERTVTDLSGRALAFARFTLALNNIDAAVRRGSLLEPVRGERFDLIVSNPPFVITPRRADVPLYEYRDGGAAGDALVAGLVRDLPAHLEPGGVAQLLANWELRAGEDWRERLGGWLGGTGLDAWVVQREVQDVAEYAETWARDGGHRPGTPGFDALYVAWLDDFAARGVERVGFGVLTLQRPASPREPWHDLVEVPHPVTAPMGPTVLAGLQARTWLAEHDEDDLLDIAWRVADDVTEERVGRPGAVDPAVIQLRQGGGLRRLVRLDTLTAGLVGACDGELTARQLCSGLAVLTEAPVEDVVRAVLPLLRELVADGLLR